MPNRYFFLSQQKFKFQFKKFRPPDESYMPDPTTRLKALINSSRALKFGGQLLIATPDSANEYKHRQWMKDWFNALEKQRGSAISIF